MASDLRRLVISLLVVIGVAVPLYRTLAYDINDVVGIHVNEDTDKKICQAQGVLSGLKAIQNGYLQQVVKDTINELKNMVTTYFFQLAICKIINFDKTIEPSIFGVQLGAITLKSPDCPIEIGGATTALLKRNFITNTKNNFFARCVADGAKKKMEDDVRDMINENGADGEPAFVQDWIGLQVDADAMARNRFSAILVNTNICPYFRDYVYQYFGVPQSYIDKPPSLTGLGLRVDGGDSFNQLAGCELPPSFSPMTLDQNWAQFGGFYSMDILLRPQNNPTGFIQMAEAELAKQREVAVAGAVNEAVAGGGFTATYGSATQSCLNKDPNGKCLAKANVQQPPGAVRDANAATYNAEFNWVDNSKEMNTLLGDVRQRFSSMFLSLQNKALNYEINFDSSSQELRDIGNGVKPPDDVNTVPDIPDSGGLGGPPGGTCGSTTDQTCTGGNPQCFCARNCPQYDPIREFIKEATLAACNQHPELVTDPVNCGSVQPGQGRLFLVAVCETGIGQTLNCHPNGDSDDEIVLAAGGSDTVSLDLITAQGAIRLPGQTVAVCEGGVQ